MTDVFISYAREDRPFVQRLHSALAAKGFDAWVDWEGIAPTAEWMREVEGAIEGADSFLFVISPDSIRSPICRRELDHAEVHQKRLVPAVHRTVEDESVPEALRVRNWIFCRGVDDFDDAVEEISASLTTDLEWVHRHTRLVVRAVEWQANNHDRSFLLRGRDLEEDERWLGEASRHEGPAVTDLQLEYLTASRQNANRTNRVRFSAVTVGLVISLAFGVFALLQRNEARRQATVARARALVANSTAAMPSDPELGLWLAIEAQHTEPSASADRLLRQGLLESRLLATYQFPKGTTAAARAARLKAAGFVSSSVNGRQSFDGTWVVNVGSPLRVSRSDGTPVANLAAAGQSMQAALNRNGTLVVTALPCNTCSDPAKVWDVATGRLLATLGDTDAHVVAFNPTANQVVTGDRKGVVRIFDVAHPDEPIAQLAAHANTVVSVAFSPDGRRVLSGSLDDTARVWEPSQESSFVLRTHSGIGGFDAGFSADGTRVATGLSAPTVRIWNAAPLRFRHLDAAPSANLAGFDTRGDRAVLGVAPCLSCADDGGDRVDEVHVLDTRSGKATLLTFAASYPFDTTLGYRLNIAISGDGRTAVADSSIVNVSDGRQKGELRGASDAFGAPALDTHGSRAVTAGPTTVSLWDTHSGRRSGVRRIPGVIATSFAPDDDRVVVASQQAAFVLNATTGAEIARLQGSGDIFRRPRFDSSGAVVATIASDGQSVRIWDADTGALRRTGFVPPVGEGVATFAFSPDGRQLLTFSDKGTIRVWDLKSGLLLVEPPSVRWPIQNQLVEAFASPDGTRITYLSWWGMDSFRCPLCAGTDRLLASAPDHVSRFVKRNADKLAQELRPSSSSQQAPTDALIR